VATRTWIAVADQNWSDPTAWDGGVAVPVTTDAIVFGPNDGNCAIDNLGTWTGGTVTVNSTYAGVITQASGVNFTSAAYSQVGGTFTCHSAATFTSTTFSVTGGAFNQGGAFVSTTFLVGAGTYTGASATMSTTAVTVNSSSGSITATSGIWTLAGSFTRTNSPTWSANGGTINITAASTFNPGNFTLNLVTLNAAAAITISSGVTCPLGAAPTSAMSTSTLTVTGVVTWSGLWTHTGLLTVTTVTGTLTGSSSPTLTISDDLDVGVAAVITNPIATITMSGTATAILTDTGDKLSGTTFVLGSGSTKGITVAANTICRLGAAPTSSVGTGTVGVNGTVTWSGLWTLTGLLTVSGAGSTLTGTSSPTLTISDDLNVASVATITNAIGTITLSGTASMTLTDTGDKLSGTTYIIGSGGVKAVIIAASTICRLGSAPTSNISTSTLTVTGEVRWDGLWTHTGLITVSATTGILTGTTSPTISLTSSLNVSSTATITNAIGTITWTGTASPTLTDTGDKLAATTYVLNKTTGTFTVAANTIMRWGADPTSVQTGGALTVTGTVTWSGTLQRTGTVTVNGTMTCGTTWVQNTSNVTIGAAGVVTGLTAISVVAHLTVTAGATWPATVDVTVLGTTRTDLIIPSGVVNLTVAKVNHDVQLYGPNAVYHLGTNPVTTCQTTGSGSIAVYTATLDWTGLWTHAGGFYIYDAAAVITGLGSPTISIADGIYVDPGCTITNPIPSITVTGYQVGGAEFYTDTADKLAATTFTITRSGSWIVDANTIMRLGANPTSTVGTLNFNIFGTLNLSGTWTHTGFIYIDATGSVTGALTTLNMIVYGWITISTGSTWPSGVNLNWTPSDGSDHEFLLDGRTFGTFRRIGSASAQLMIAGSNTFTTFRDNDGLVAHSLKFAQGTTQTAALWLLGGSGGKLLTMDTDTGAGVFTLRSTGSAVRASYCSITRSTVDASPTWTADPSCTNGGGNTNWIFGSLYFDQSRQRKRGRRWIPLVA
jgi:hypothetical protein